MSRENVETITRVAEAFNGGDFEAVLASVVAPEFRYITSGVWPGEDGVFQTAAEYVRFVERTFGEFDDLQFQLDEVVDAGDRVLVALTMRGRGRESGAETTWSFHQVWTFREGRAVRGQGFANREAALEAAGLTG